MQGDLQTVIGGIAHRDYVGDSRPSLVRAHVVLGDSCGARVWGRRGAGDARIKVISHRRKGLIDVRDHVAVKSLGTDIGDRKPKARSELPLNTKAPTRRAGDIVSGVEAVDDKWGLRCYRTSRWIVEGRTEEGSNPRIRRIARRALSIVPFDSVVTDPIAGTQGRLAASRRVPRKPDSRTEGVVMVLHKSPGDTVLIGVDYTVERGPDPATIVPSGFTVGAWAGLYALARNMVFLSSYT